MPLTSAPKRANRPLVAELPPVKDWRTEYHRATLYRGRYPSGTIGYVVRICVHNGTYIDEKISDPALNYAWGINLSAACEHEKCRKAMRIHNG